MLDTLNSTITESNSSDNESTTEYSTTPRYSAISKHSSVKGTPQAIRAWLMSSRQDSPVSPSAKWANAKAVRIIETCGQQRLNASALYDRDSCSWKTSQTSLALGISEPSSPIWTRSGMWANGTVFPLVPSAPLTAATAYGVMLPTPLKSDWSKTNFKYETTLRRRSERTTGHGSLPEWLTWKTRISGYPNPAFYEHVMGFPIGWTELKPLAMARFQQWRQQHGKY